MALCVWRLHVQPPVIIRNIGVTLTGLALPAIMAFLYAGWNDPSRRRTIGVLWDVGTFWPRSYHPLCPPCYAERAVPDLQRRMWWLHDNGGHVMLTSHSQGTVLAAAALLQSGCRPANDRPALITFGSPLIKLYGWGFPAYFGPGLLGSLAPGGPHGSATGTTSTTRPIPSAARRSASRPISGSSTRLSATTSTGRRCRRRKATPATGPTRGSGP